MSIKPYAICCRRETNIEVVEPRQKHSKTWISQPGAGLEKRQCTLQLCSRADGKQPRIAIIFRGTGKRIRQDEKDAWHPDVLAG